MVDALPTSRHLTSRITAAQPDLDAGRAGVTFRRARISGALLPESSHGNHRRERTAPRGPYAGCIGWLGLGDDSISLDTASPSLYIDRMETPLWAGGDIVFTAQSVFRDEISLINRQPHRAYPAAQHRRRPCYQHKSITTCTTHSPPASCGLSYALRQIRGRIHPHHHSVGTGPVLFAWCNCLSAPVRPRGTPDAPVSPLPSSISVGARRLPFQTVSGPKLPGAEGKCYGSGPCTSCSTAGIEIVHTWLGLFSGVQNASASQHCQPPLPFPQTT